MGRHASRSSLRFHLRYLPALKLRKTGVIMVYFFYSFFSSSPNQVFGLYQTMLGGFCFTANFLTSVDLLVVSLFSLNKVSYQNYLVSGALGALIVLLGFVTEFFLLIIGSIDIFLLPT